MIKTKFFEKISSILEQFNFILLENEKVFINHLLGFIERTRANEELNIEITQDLLDQVPKNILEDSKKIAYEILESENIFIKPNEKEIFLISTHLMQIEREIKNHE